MSPVDVFYRDTPLAPDHTARLDSAHYTDTTPAHHLPEGEGSPDVRQLGCEQLGAAVLRLLASDALTNIFC